MRSDVVVLGGAGADTVVYVPDLPLPYADSHLVPAIETRAGQTGDNVALGLSALGLRTVHIDVLGDDREGDLVRALHERSGVPLVALPTKAGTKRAVNLVDPQGRRQSLYDISRGDDADRLPVPLVTEHVRNCRHVHVSITHPCQHLMPDLAGLGATVSVDLHNWDGDDPYHELFARHADIIFLSATALSGSALSGEACTESAFSGSALADGAPPGVVLPGGVPSRLEVAMRRLLSLGRAGVVIATAGAEGGFVLERGATAAWRFAAEPPAGPTIDSNGAGDAFVSGYLFGHLRGETVRSSVRFGAIAGAHACTVPSTQVSPLAQQHLVARFAGS